jgi:hypothetical protein
MSYKKEWYVRPRNCLNRDRQATRTLRKIKMGAHLNADALFAVIRKDLAQVPDHRAANASITMGDAQMSTILDEVLPESIQRPFRSVFH